MPCIYLRLNKILLDLQLQKKEIQRKTTNSFA